jgi:C-terminal processing protease CtpA/Prc
MRKTLVLLAWALLAAAAAAAEAPTDRLELQRTADRVLERVAQHWRAQEIPSAVALLQQLHDTPGMDRLESLWPNLLYNLACGHALLGEKERALGFLEQAERAGFAEVDQLARDGDLAGVRDDPRFVQVLAALEGERRLWSGAALRTPYRDTLSVDERLAGLARVWSEVKYNFAYFDRVRGLDWDSLFVAYLPRVREAPATLDYYRLLQRMCAQLGDGHTAVHVPDELYGRLYYRPPLDTRWLDGHVYVAAVLHDTLRRAGIRPGLELVRIDGVPVAEHAARDVAPYVSASTPQGRNAIVYEFYLLGGARGTPVQIEFADERGARFTRTLARTYGRVQSYPRRLEYRVVGRNVAYVALHSFGWHDVVAEFDSLLPSIARADGLVLDLRRNTGGNSDVGFDLLGYLTTSPFPIPAWSAPDYRPMSRAMGRGRAWEADPPGTWSAHGSQAYTGPVAVLIGPQTGSAAEDFCVAFESMGRGEILGEPSAGTTGQPLFYPLPGGGQGLVCTCRVTYPDGREFVGVGVQPRLGVRPSARDLARGRDVVLEAALERLQGARH